MWSLGITLYQVLTRELPKLDREDEFLYLPQPFCGIVRHTLRRDPAERWAVDDVERHLNPPAPAPPPPAPAPQPVAATPPQMPMPLAMTPAEPEPPRAAPPISERLVLERPMSGPPIAEPPMPEPVAETPTLPPPTRPTRWEPPIDRGFPIKWAPAIGLVAAIALSAILFRHPSQPKAAPATAQPPAVQQPSKPAPPPAPISATARPAASAPEPATAESSTPSAMPSTGARIWRVVAYTYGNRKSAESMARKLNEKHTGMRAEVFAPSGERYPYYVALGGRMTLAQAQAVQKQARSKGLPRDTFVRNFSN
jgi:hypothetical protein